MRIIYVTDLHGWQRGYERVLEHAVECEAAAIVNGGDMLPKVKDAVPAQRRFLDQFMAPFLGRCAWRGIAHYGMFGNEDLLLHWPRWKAYVDACECAFDLTDRWHAIEGGLWMRGCGFVPDFPYRIKDLALRDDEGVPRPEQREPPVRSAADDIEPIDDLERYFAERPTLREELEKFGADCPDQSRAIAVIHAPPIDTGLGVLPKEGDVGSVAVRDWIEHHQPMLALHGHIHESPDVTGCCTHQLGRTTCHQPGQRGPAALSLSEIEITEKDVHLERRVLDV
ncbi:MAG: metallophosphoesterase family protein [Phycisphaeraceae bacterium]